MNTLVSVKVRDGEIDKALRIFKKRVFNSGHLLELKDRTEFEKPSVTKRRTKLSAIYKQKFNDTMDG